MKKLVVNALINQISGDHPIQNLGGARGIAGFRFKKASKKQYLQVTGKRNYENHPITARELAARAAFKTASAQVKLILNDDDQKVLAMKEFNDAVAKKFTTATTLRGYLMQKYI